MFQELVQPHAQLHVQQDLPVEVGLLILGNIYRDMFYKCTIIVTDGH
jgi:hypothetical protein